jgi:acylphosphatase
MSTLIARRCLVSGRVQGVFFRASTREKALQLGCTGYARNLPDGRVEVLVVGAPLAAQALIDWLWIGPPSAHVTQVDVQTEALGEVPTGFTTR